MTFDVQLDNIMKIQEENFQHPVFACLTPRGEIPPGESGHIGWIFSPLEAKTYTVRASSWLKETDSDLKFFRFLSGGCNEMLQLNRAVCLQEAESWEQISGWSGLETEQINLSVSFFFSQEEISSTTRVLPVFIFQVANSNWGYP